MMSAVYITSFSFAAKITEVKFGGRKADKSINASLLRAEQNKVQGRRLTDKEIQMKTHIVLYSGCLCRAFF